MNTADDDAYDDDEKNEVEERTFTSEYNHFFINIILVQIMRLQ